MKKSLLFPLAIVFLLMGLVISSCKKDDDLGPMRQFATSGKISINAGETTALITWKEAVNTDSTKSTYTVEIAQDSLFTNGAEFSYMVQSPSLTVRDSQLTIRVPYFVRVKTNGATPELDSRWVYSAHFSLTGEQIFLPVRDVDTKFNSIILRWKDTTNAVLTKIVLTPDGGAPADYPLTQADLDSSFKKIVGLSATTRYHAQIFTASKEKGFTDFKTKDVPVYAYTIDPSMDLAKILDTCAPSIIIGLDPGIYMPSATYTLKSKSVTLMSVSANPMDTKVVFREFKLMGDGAGLNLQDLRLVGDSAALYFLNLAGLASDAAAASFANISIQNCRVDSFGNCIMRANRGTAAGDHKIGAITINNTIFSNNLLKNLYTEFTLDKLAFQTFTVTNSTFATIGRALILMSANLPAGTPAPVILFDHNTVNHWGTGGTRALLDANANPVQATFTNNIFANTPRAVSGAAVNAAFIRASGTGSTIVFSNNNVFKLMDGAATPAPLTLPTTATANQTLDLGWSPATMDFTIPAGSPLRTLGTGGGAMGDPRWN